MRNIKVTIIAEDGQEKTFEMHNVVGDASVHISDAGVEIYGHALQEVPREVRGI